MYNYSEKAKMKTDKYMKSKVDQRVCISIPDNNTRI